DGIHVLSACSRSAIKSSLSSMPMDSRTTSGAAPDFTLAASSSWLWVVEAGWITSERVSPTLARCENSFRFDTRLTPASYPPLRLKVNTAPAPFGEYLRARLLYLSLGSPA